MDAKKLNTLKMMIVSTREQTNLYLIMFIALIILFKLRFYLMISLYPQHSLVWQANQLFYQIHNLLMPNNE